MTTNLARWGNSLAVRLPRAVVRAAGFQEGDRVELHVEENGTVVLVPARRWTALERLVGQIRPENRHEEIEWGAARENGR